MRAHSSFGRRSLGVTAAAVVTVGMAWTGTASAAPPAPSASVAGDTLTVIGTPRADHVALRLASGDPTTLQVVFGDGATVQSFSRAAFSKVSVLLLEGTDRFDVDQSNGAFADEAVTVDGGNGDDTLLGGDGNEVFIGGNGDDTVDGNKGADSATLGNGDDTFVWDAGDGSDRVDGGNGPDALVFNGASGDETMRLSPIGTASVFLRSPGAVRMDMVDVEALRVNALGGVDAITLDDVTGTTLRDVGVDLGASGAPDQKTDTVTINGTDGADDVSVGASGGQVDVEGLRAAAHISGADHADRLHVSTGGGDDGVAVSDGARSLMDIAVDLGTGQL